MAVKSDIFEGVPTAQLQAELVRRNKEEKEDSIPEPLKNIDFEYIIKLCQEYISDVSKGIADDDYDCWFFGETMMAVFGPQIWQWINKEDHILSKNLPCPFCGSNNIEIQNVGDWACTAMAVICHDCGMEGPTSEDSDVAEQLWNKRTELPNGRKD